MTTHEIQPSKSIEGLDKAIQELDGMYLDLRRRSVQTSENLPLPNFLAEDGDYDVPRPAQGIFNNMTPSTPTYLPLVKEDLTKSKRFHSVSQIETSHFSSGESDYSSGFGTLPNRSKTPRSPADFEFTPIFEPQIPPFPVIDSDSDYDEPKSHKFDIFNHPIPPSRSSVNSSDNAEPKSLSIDTAVYNSSIKAKRETSSSSELDYDEPKSRISKIEILPILTRTKSTTSSIDYNEPKSPSSDINVYNYPILTKRKSATYSTDYDEPKSRLSDAEVYSSPRTARRKSSSPSSDYHEVEEHPPVSMNRLLIKPTVETDYDEVYNVPTPRKDTFHSEVLTDMMTIDKEEQDVFEVIEIGNNNDHKEEVNDLKDQNTNITQAEITKFEREETPVAIVVEEVHPNDVMNERTFPAALTSKEPTRRFTFYKRHKSTVRKDKQKDSSSERDPNEKNFIIRFIDAGAQKMKSGSKGPECPCKCRYAVPLMSAAIIICIVLFIIMAAGYVYIGINMNQRHADSNIQDLFNSTDGASGSGDVL